MTRSWSNFDESKRDGGPLGFGSNQTAAFLAQFAMFFWGFAQYLKAKKARLLSYGLIALTIFATMYTFSRGAYLALLLSVLILGLLKDRKLLVILGVFLLTWQTVVPSAVRERINMTHGSDGQLEASAQERVDLWDSAEQAFLRDPIIGNGFATFQYGQHVDNLSDTHNWFVKILVETGIVGFIIVAFLLQGVLSLSYGLFRRASDPLYQVGSAWAFCRVLFLPNWELLWRSLDLSRNHGVNVGASRSRNPREKLHASAV